MNKITLCSTNKFSTLNIKIMFDILSEITDENAAHEYYLTDAIAIALRKGLKCSAVECPVDEAAAANTREELAYLEKLLTERRKK